MDTKKGYKMISVKEIEESNTQVVLEINQYKELFFHKDPNWRAGKDMYDPELVQEREAFFNIMQIIDEKIKQNNDILQKLGNDVKDKEKTILLKANNDYLIKFIMNFFK